MTIIWWLKVLDRQSFLADAIMLTDQEPSIMAVANGIKGIRQKALDVRETPRRSSESVGACSR